MSKGMERVNKYLSTRKNMTQKERNDNDDKIVEQVIKDSALSSTVEGSQAEYDFVNKDEEDAYRDYCEQQAKDNGGYPEE